MARSSRGSVTVELAIVTPMLLAGFGLLVSLINIGSTQGSARLQVESAAEQIAHGQEAARALKPLEALGVTRTWDELGQICVSLTGSHHLFGIVGFDIPMSLKTCAAQTPVT